MHEGGGGDGEARRRRVPEIVATVSSEHGTRLVTAACDVVFGRGSGASIRIGAAPVHDEVVPRCAGRVFAIDGRVVVENLDDQLAFDLREPNRALIPVPPGHWHAPADPTFDILVCGAVTYELGVTVNIDGVRTVRLPTVGGPDDGPPTGAVPHLTERHRRVLDAYVEPLSRGGLVATHQQVADRLGISRSLVRLECERIWSALFLAGVPMRDLGDARDEIVDAWVRHRF